MEEEQGSNDRYQEGYDAGYTLGYEDGHSDGHDEGNTSGFDAGYEEAINDNEYNEKHAKEEYEKEMIPDLDDIVAAIKTKDYNHLLVVINRIYNKYTLSDLT